MNNTLRAVTGEEYRDRSGRLYWQVVQTDSNGIAHPFKMLHDDFLKSLDDSSGQSKKKAVHVGTLPRYYHDSWLGDNSDDFVCILDIPAHKDLMTYYANVDEPILIPYPRLLMVIESSNGYYRGKLFSVKGTDELCADTQLFMYPFGNVSADGGICFGNIRTKLNSISDAACLYELFINGITNDDYCSDALAKTSTPIEQYKLFELLHTLDSFPEDLLKRSNISYGDIFRKCQSYTWAY